MYKRRTAVAVAVTLAVLVAPAALAGKGGKPGGGGGGGGGSLTLVVLEPDDGGANWGEQVTFQLSTSASQPYVDVSCYQGGSLVYASSAGFFAGYPWPWTTTFTLRSSSWTAGAADCAARMYSVSNNGRKTTLASTSFHVLA
jgi:hypothetical protein